MNQHLLSLLFPVRLRNQIIKIASCLSSLISICNFVIAQTEVSNTITYTGSGLPNTATGGDVFANQPTVGGFVHKTITSHQVTSILIVDPYTGLSGYYTYATPEPGYDDVKIQLGSSTHYETCTGCSGRAYFLVTDGYQIGYTFTPGYNYFVSMNYSATIGATGLRTIGTAISVGDPPQLTTNPGSTGTALQNRFSGFSMILENNFINTPIYSSYLTTANNSTFYNLTIPPFSVPSNTTGLNIEALPDFSTGIATFNIASLTITGLPSISPADQVVCTSKTFSINTSWPITWTASPSNIISLIPSGNTVAVSQVGNGIVTLTANVTDPAGYNCQLSRTLEVGTPAPPTNVFFNGGSVDPSSLCPNTQYSAVVYPTDYTRYEWYMPNGWTSSNANSGPTPWVCYDYEFDFQTDASSTGEMAVAKVNACGLSDVVHIQTSLDCGGYYYYSISPNPTTSRVTVDGSAKKKNIKEIQLVDNLGNLRKATKYASNTQRVNLDVSDVTKGNYCLRIYDGKTWVVKQISIH